MHGSVCVFDSHIEGEKIQSGRFLSGYTICAYGRENQYHREETLLGDTKVRMYHLACLNNVPAKGTRSARNKIVYDKCQLGFKV